MGRDRGPALRPRALHRHDRTGDQGWPEPRAAPEPAEGVLPRLPGDVSRQPHRLRLRLRPGLRPGPAHRQRLQPPRQARALKVAVLGLGNAGFDLHVPALLGLPGIETIAVDTDAGRRQRAQERYKVAAFDSLDAALAQKPDVVVVATPPDSHAALCRRIMEAGADVFCEKPFAPSVADAQTIIDDAKRTGRRVALNHEFREMPIFRALMDQVGKPDVGGVVFAQAWQNMDLPPWKEPGWRGKLLTGTLYEAGLHLTDYLIALFGEKPVAVTATMSTCGVREEASDSVALVTMEFSRGRLAQVVQN